MMGRIILSVTLVGSAFAVSASPLRILQLDLARQMETPTFISNYIDRVSAYGYNALELYLEGRVGTTTFSLPPGERYAAETMKGIVRHAADKGMIVIPVVSFLGHAEHFFKYPGLESICETREGRFRLGSGHNTFCHSAPGAQKFFENYLADLCEIFPGPYFHAGFDEAWNSGVCSLCAPKEKRDELFAEEVLNIHRILRRHGKRMMMWDDFFGFHPKALAQMPRDIVMMHWSYDREISGRGDRFNFAGRLREDALAKYAKLGFDAIPCSWKEPDNIRSSILYARRNRTLGYLKTQWEEHIPDFHGGSLPRVLATALMLDDPAGAQAVDTFPKAVRQLFPSLSPVEVKALVRSLENPADALAAEVLEQSALAHRLGEVTDDPFAETSLFDDVLCRARMAGLRRQLGRAEKLLADPRRTEADVAAARRLLAPLPGAGVQLLERRAAQFAAWRQGCSPYCVTNAPARVVSKATELLQTAAVAAADEKRLELELTMVDFYGRPCWTIEGQFADGWREIGRGSWKPGDNDGAAYTVAIPFRSSTMPTALRFSYSGYGVAGLRFASVEDRTQRLVPQAVVAATSQVREPSAVLTDDFTTVWFGYEGYLRQFYDEKMANEKFELTISLKVE